MNTRQRPLTRPSIAFYLILALSIASLSPPASHAFERDIHVAITVEVLKAQGFDFSGAVPVAFANDLTDIAEYFVDAAHGDNNELAASSERLDFLVRDIATKISTCQRGLALVSLGQALHTVQDVYSHTNSIENDKEIKLLEMTTTGEKGEHASCSLPDFAPEGLVSGYFNYHTALIGGDQCAALPSDECCHQNLNKDGPDKDDPAKNDLHKKALIAAKAGTVTYLDMVEAEILNPLCQCT